MKIELSAGAFALVVAGCSPHGGFGFPDASSDASASSVPGPTCTNAAHYTIDGLFTGYPTYVDPTSTPASPMPRSPFEWESIPPIAGQFTRMYADACATPWGNELYFANDWVTNDVGPIDALCYNRFDFFDEASHDAIEVRVYGDQHIVISKNGVDVTADAAGAAGFASSPNLARPHTIFEFSMFLPSDNSAWFMSPSDPCQPTPPPGPPPNLGDPPATVGTGCEDPSYLLDEPVTARLAFGPSGVAVSRAPDVPRVSGVDAFTTAPGARVILRGRRFGDAPGTITVDGVPAAVLVWTDSRVQFAVPAGVTAGQVVIAGDGFSLEGPRLGVSATAH